MVSRMSNCNVPMAPQMLLHTESLAKAFTATAVMMLVEEGKIGLDDKIGKYLPEAPALWNEVTIRTRGSMSVLLP
jgi:CubicO group peptidase (beta-lactamase class C family)